MIDDLPPIEDGVYDENNPLHCSPKLNAWHKKIIQYTLKENLHGTTTFVLIQIVIMRMNLNLTAVKSVVNSY